MYMDLSKAKIMVFIIIKTFVTIIEWVMKSKG